MKMKKFLRKHSDNIIIVLGCAVCICIGFSIGVDNAFAAARMVRFGNI